MKYIALEPAWRFHFQIQRLNDPKVLYPRRFAFRFFMLTLKFKTAKIVYIIWQTSKMKGQLPALTANRQKYSQPKYRISKWRPSNKIIGQSHVGVNTRCFAAEVCHLFPLHLLVSNIHLDPNCTPGPVHWECPGFGDCRVLPLRMCAVRFFAFTQNVLQLLDGILAWSYGILFWHLCAILPALPCLAWCIAALDCFFRCWVFFRTCWMLHTTRLFCFLWIAMFLLVRFCGLFHLQKLLAFVAHLLFPVCFWLCCCTPWWLMWLFGMILIRPFLALCCTYNLLRWCILLALLGLFFLQLAPLCICLLLLDVFFLLPFLFARLLLLLFLFLFCILGSFLFFFLMFFHLKLLTTCHSIPIPLSFQDSCQSILAAMLRKWRLYLGASNASP